MQKKTVIQILGLVCLPLSVDASPAREALAVRAGGLTADECVRRALKTAPSLDAARADIAEQEAATLRVMSEYIPDLTLEASYRRTSSANIDFSLDDLFSGIPNPPQIPSFEQPRNNYAVQASLRVPLSEYAWQVVPALRAARSNEAASRYRRQAQGVRVALSARLAYYRWLRSLARIGVAKQAVHGARARLADARQGLAAGTLAQVDVLRLESLLGSSQLALTRAESERQIAERDLALLIGGDGPFAVGEDLFKESPPGTSDAPEHQAVEKLIAHGREQRPDARALLKSMDAARDAGLRSWSEYFPQLEAVGTVNYANPNQLFFPPTNEWNVNWFIALSLRWTASRVLRGHAEIKRFEAAEAAFRAQLDQLRRAIEREVRSNWHRWRQATTALDVNAKKLVAAEAAHEQMEKRYAAGLSTTTDVIDAENTRSRAALDEVDSRIELRVAHARLLSGAGHAQAAEQVLSPKQTGRERRR